MTTVSKTKSSRMTTRYITVTAIFSALAFVLQLIEIPLPMIMPTFIKFDLSDLPALIGAFSLGPVCGISIEFLKNLLHAILSSHSFGVGELSNFILGAVFVGIAGLYYKSHKTKKGAIIGSLLGAISMAVISFPSNLFVVYPFYYNFMPKDTIIQAYQAIFPAVDSIEKCLLIFNVPFTFMKGIIDVIITMLVYKKISPVIHGK
jgi:riboflavin transporter